MVASGNLTLEDANRETWTIDLKVEKDSVQGPSIGAGFPTLQRKGSSGSTSSGVFPGDIDHHFSSPAYDLPLFGHCCCRLAVSPDVKKVVLPGTVKAWLDGAAGDDSKLLKAEEFAESEGSDVSGYVTPFTLHLRSSQSKNLPPKLAIPVNAVRG
jgi:hypothetical protein